MGQTLSEPITEKKTVTELDSQLYYVTSGMQGWRISMEDAHASILQLKGSFKSKPVAFFGVYDGHGGSAVSTFAGEHLHDKISELDSFEKGDYATALYDGYFVFDEQLRSNSTVEHDLCGSTACCCIISSDWKLFTANAGDSRAVLSSEMTPIVLTRDHKPDVEEEKNRIIQAGGYVGAGRVMGNLAMSRALGDFDFKKNISLSPAEQMVTCKPDISERQLDASDDFLVIACDGIWDCMSNEDIVRYLTKQIAITGNVTEAVESLMDKCLSPDYETVIGSDNMTITVVALLRGRSLEEWIEHIRQQARTSGVLNE